MHAKDFRKGDTVFYFGGQMHIVESTSFVYDEVSGYYVGDTRNVITGNRFRMKLLPSTDRPTYRKDWHNSPVTHSYA